MSIRWLFIAILIICGTITQAQTTRETLTHDDIERNYRIFVPDHYDLAQGGHLLMVLHGGGMDNLLMRQVIGERIAERIIEEELNVIVVYPNGFGNGWNDGRIRENWSDSRQNIDDVSLLLSLADTLADGYNIDPNALFVTGFSNGGGMAYRLACDTSNRITAIAPVASLLADGIPCEPDTSVALLSIFGDDDPILPITGGDIDYWGTSLGRVHSLDDTLDIWASANNCNGFDDPITLADIADDDTTANQISDADCDTPLISIIIHGGGHTWAGSSYTVPTEEYGRTSQDINAGDMIVDFFISVGLGK